MCSCSWKIGSTDTPGYSQYVPMDPLLKDVPLVKIDFAWCINPDKVKAAFSPYGLNISNKNDLKIIADSISAGTDLKAYNVSFLSVINNIKFTQAEYDNASCQILLTR